MRTVGSAGQPDIHRKYNEHRGLHAPYTDVRESSVARACQRTLRSTPSVHHRQSPSPAGEARAGRVFAAVIAAACLAVASRSDGRGAGTMDERPRPMTLDGPRPGGAEDSAVRLAKVLRGSRDPRRHDPPGRCTGARMTDAIGISARTV